MQKYKKPKFTKKDLGNNPHITSLQIKVVKRNFEKQYYRDEEGNLLPVQQEVEYTPFVKLYSTAEHRKLANNLSLRAKELLLWLMYEIPVGEDYIWINKERYMEENQVSSINTYKEAIKELVRYCFLSISVIPDVFWINPEFFFKGDRVKKYSNNLLIVHED